MRGIVTCASTSSSLAGNWTLTEPGGPSDKEHSRVGFTPYVFHRLDGTSEMQAASVPRTDAEKLGVHSHHVSVHLPTFSTSGTLIPDEPLYPTFSTQTRSCPPSPVSGACPSPQIGWVLWEPPFFSFLPKAVPVNAGNSSSPSPSCSH